MILWLLTILRFFPYGGSIPYPDAVFQCSDGKTVFRSDAPLEDIQAESNALRGAVNITDKTFLFSVSVKTFEGFNSALQKEHFNENYMESNRFPEASFRGKIIEDVDMGNDGTYDVRAKGILDVHGVKQERIIRCKIELKGTRLIVRSEFTVLLEDHNIKIPKVVHQKISPEILVEIQATLNAVKQ